MRLALAQQALVAVLDHASSLGTSPLGVVVLDGGAHTIACARQDGASLFRIDIAAAKASGALGMGADSRVLAERAAGNPVFFTSLAVATGGAVALSAGGLLVRDAAGSIIGAIGVSGDAPDIDEACARAGLAAIQQGTS